MNTNRILELCKAVDDSSARAEDVRELAKLAREQVNELKALRAQGAYHEPEPYDNGGMYGHGY